MKKVKAIVKDKTILELVEDAKAGDIIDLKELVSVDTSYLDSIIESGKDKVYASKMLELQKRLDAEKKIEITNLKTEIEVIKKEYEGKLLIQAKDDEKKYLDQIASLKEEITKLNEKNAHDLDNFKNEKNNEINALNSKIEAINKDNSNALILKEKEIDKKWQEEVAKLNTDYSILLTEKNALEEKITIEKNSEIAKIKAENDHTYNDLKNKYDNLLLSKNNEIENAILKSKNDSIAEMANLRKSYEINITELKNKNEVDMLKALDKQKNDYETKIKEKDELINNLQRAKASLNVKQTGEDLESWCNNEVTSYMQNGLFNCTWIKDNKVVKDEDEAKGSKADYIFKIYAGNDHKEDELLASVCMDMKDENPDSVNKKTNASYYKQLDKNREKKNCKYAVLVSNLEIDKPNLLPIYKVIEYENMYVVRPAYLMVFLNMITSLTTRFATLLLSKEQESIEFKEKNDILDEFEDIKKTYLDKPLEGLQNNVDAVMNSAINIRTECDKIEKLCNKINESYISKIQEKINKFDLKLNKELKKA